MLNIKGKVINIIDKAPYKNKQGIEVLTIDVDIKADTERFFQTVSMPAEYKSALKIGEEVELPISQFTGISKTGSAYTINRFIELKDNDI